jgi:hypothetical protein
MWGRVWGWFFTDPNNRIDIKALFLWFDSSPATSRGMTWRYLARKAKDGSVAISGHIRPDQANNFGGREGGIIGQIGRRWPYETVR